MSREPVYISCSNGLFTIPESCLSSLKSHAKGGVVYVRADEDSVTISPTRLVDSRRRHINERYRVPLFRTATKLAVLDLCDHYQFMAVEWRGSTRGRVTDTTAIHLAEND